MRPSSNWAQTPSWPDVELDPERIRQVLENLIANALRYTRAAGQFTSSALSKDARHSFRQRYRRGDSLDDLPHVFDRFHKSRDSRGTGLGLAIAKNLVVAHAERFRCKAQSAKAQLSS